MPEKWTIRLDPDRTYTKEELEDMQKWVGTLNEEVKQTTENMILLLATGNSVLRMMRRLGLPEEIGEATIMINKFYRAAYLAQVALTQLAILEATVTFNPMAFVKMGVALGGLVATASDLSGM